MGDIKNCTRCGGRMFLEFDYYDQNYDFVCISCGRLEPSRLSQSNIDHRLSGLKTPDVRKAGELSRV
jgi:hypothetical protein